MINTLLAYDNADDDLGTFYALCALQSKIILQEIACLYEFDANLLDRSNIENKISDFNGSPFLFIAFSHGLPDALINNSERFICTENAYFFGKSIVYTFACHASIELGEALINEGCHAFLGYDKEVHHVVGYECVFIECICFALQSMIDGENIGTAIKLMQDKYTYYIDIFDDTGDFILLYNLRKNRDSLRLSGNPSTLLSTIDFEP
ncbi:MAG: hypothetical protein IPM47_07075 [Sphingobacteriales bacterium]|nr:MAG: hypothetical protein IPM47_07075 [Sphingobacteriales bacterium]